MLKDIDNCHPARPKPLYKTQKKDEHGIMMTPVPIRNVSTACGTLTHNLSKVCQTAIKHLTSEESLPRNNKSTNAALRRIIFVNENFSPPKEESILVFPDIKKMYPSTDTKEAVEEVKEKYKDDPSEHGFSTECVVAALSRAERDFGLETETWVVSVSVSSLETISLKSQYQSQFLRPK